MTKKAENKTKQKSSLLKSKKENKIIKPGKTVTPPAKKLGAAAKPAEEKADLSSRAKKILKIKQSLLMKKEELLKEAGTALNTLPGELNFPDMGDQATAEADRDFMLRLRDRERMLLKKIDEAVERIDNGTFGICETCSNEIGIKRLEARPVTTFCIDCKTRQEEEEKIAEGG